MFKIDDMILSEPLSSLFQEICLSMSYINLLNECETVFASIEKQARNIEVSSRDQT